jgi:hypothetical protein
MLNNQVEAQAEEVTTTQPASSTLDHVAVELTSSLSPFLSTPSCRTPPDALNFSSSSSSSPPSAPPPSAPHPVYPILPPAIAYPYPAYAVPSPPNNRDTNVQETG